LNLQIREINETHYKKVCPVETVEGKNAGLIWSLTKESRINKYGFIETPFYVRLKNSKKENNLMKLWKQELRHSYLYKKIIKI
jgi:DNA-directed RNA polymerase subunit beta